MKAIRIKKDNKRELEDRYQMSADTLEFSAGLYLIAGFGDVQYEGLLTKQELLDKFFSTGKKLDNDFFEVVKKSNYIAGPIFSDV